MGKAFYNWIVKTNRLEGVRFNVTSYYCQNLIRKFHFIALQTISNKICKSACSRMIFLHSANILLFCGVLADIAIINSLIN